MIVSLILGLLVVIQIRSFASMNYMLIRDSESNIFQEIKILKDKNTLLRKEIEALEGTIEQLNDQTSSLEVIEAEIDKYKNLSGDYTVFGPGLKVVINGELNVAWVVDLINEFFNAGAEAVALNGIRITDRSSGFDTLPQGQILFNGTTLSEPYEFDIIGEGGTIEDIILLQGGIIDRLLDSISDATVETEVKEIIEVK